MGFIIVIVLVVLNLYLYKKNKSNSMCKGCNEDCELRIK